MTLKAIKATDSVTRLPSRQIEGLGWKLSKETVPLVVQEPQHRTCEDIETATLSIFRLFGVLMRNQKSGICKCLRQRPLYDTCTVDIPLGSIEKSVYILITTLHSAITFLSAALLLPVLAFVSRTLFCKSSLPWKIFAKTARWEKRTNVSQSWMAYDGRSHDRRDARSPAEMHCNYQALHVHRRTNRIPSARNATHPLSKRLGQLLPKPNLKHCRRSAPAWKCSPLHQRNRSLRIPPHH